MAGERVITPTTGKWGLDATTGKRLLLDSSDECDECCGGACTASATACGNCSAGDTPTAYTAVFSGVNLCTACHLNAVAGQDVTVAWTTGDAINTTHTLTQVGSGGTQPCRWEKTIANAVDVFFYTTADGSCGTPDPGTGFPLSNDLLIRLQKTAANTWVLTATGGGFLVLYYHSFTGDGSGECETVPASSNALTLVGSCGNATTGGSQGGYGGSATITCQ